ncbi:UNVERIFIED_CONTAM: hypothetical protein K2H54_062850 [Gekko kuhli]
MLLKCVFHQPHCSFAVLHKQDLPVERSQGILHHGRMHCLMNKVSQPPYSKSRWQLPTTYKGTVKRQPFPSYFYLLIYWTRPPSHTHRDQGSGQHFDTFQ